MKNLKSFLVYFLIFISVYSQEECFTIAVGKSCTKDGSVILAHNEDSGPLVNHVFFWKINKMKKNKGEKKVLVRGSILEETREINGYINIQVFTCHYCDGFLNDYGVALCSDACPSKEKKPKIEEGGIGFFLRRIIAERAKSAREGVDIARSLIERFGYVGGGRTLFIADPKEIWLFCILGGKHYLAKRVPDDKVAVVANSFTLKKVDLNKPEDCISSRGLIDYAIKRKWIKTKPFGPINFSFIFSKDNVLRSKVNYLRQWRGITLISKIKIQPSYDNLPQFIQPNRKIGPEDLFKILRDHYEGSVFDIKKIDNVNNPNFSTKVRPICHFTTRTGVVYQLKNGEPKGINCRLWLSPTRPDVSPFIPWYLGMNDVPPGFNSGDRNKVLEMQIKMEPWTEKLPENVSIFEALRDAVDKDYYKNIKIIKNLWSDFENECICLQKDIEKKALELYKKSKKSAFSFITAYSFGQTWRAVAYAKKLIKRISKIHRSKEHKD